ncbi:MAG: sigma-54 dependent transcriptional regulator, partial [Myxococcota bacterium]|nr:sigma-54 dependent transcriptional regulator [Myxococcota bacterium]
MTSTPAGSPTQVLVVDDEAPFRRSLGLWLRRKGYEVTEAASGEEALERIHDQDFQLALVDVQMPGMEATEVIRGLRRLSPLTETIVVTGFGDAEIAYQVLREGACDYIEKPITDWDRFFHVLHKAQEIRDLKAERARLTKQRSSESLDQLIGNSPAMRELTALIRQVAPTPVPVLIAGESGSGKERVARAIHAASPRSEGPWVAINCAAIPSDLLESELFGFEKGGHSTATQAKPGLFETANEGTLFLDEIGEMPASMQAKLLRVLQEREVSRLGGTRTIPINARIVAATNVDLKDAIQKKEFREDLYYRLRVVEIRVPPLRERREDVPLLAYYFVQKYNEEFGKQVRHISDRANDALQAHDWEENNVRELEHSVQRA